MKQLQMTIEGDEIPVDEQGFSITDGMESLVIIERGIKELEEKKKALKEKLLRKMQEVDVYTIKTGAYSMTRVKKPYVKVLDVERLKRELDGKDIPYYMQEVFAPSMDIVFKQLGKTGEVIPGLDYHESEYVMVTLAKKK